MRKKVRILGELVAYL